MDTRPQPQTLDVEADMLDVGLYVRNEYPGLPLLVFGPAGDRCVFPDLEPGSNTATTEADPLPLVHALGALEALGYCENDMEVRQLVDPDARYDRAGPLRQRRAVYRIQMMGVDDDG